MRCVYSLWEFVVCAALLALVVPCCGIPALIFAVRSQSSYRHGDVTASRATNLSALRLITIGGIRSTLITIIIIMHSFVCKRAPGKTSRHHAFNDLIARGFSFAGLPVTKEPLGLFRSDGKRPDGLTLDPWSSGKALCWDVTVTSQWHVHWLTHTSMQPPESQARRQI